MIKNVKKSNDNRGKNIAKLKLTIEFISKSSEVPLVIQTLC